MLDGGGASGSTTQMPPSNEPRARLDEQAALEELERLRRALEQSRQRRKQANEEFDSFLRSFKRRPEPSAAETSREEPVGPRYARSPDPRPKDVAEPVPPAALTRRPDRPSTELPAQHAIPPAIAGAIDRDEARLSDLPSETAAADVPGAQPATGVSSTASAAIPVALRPEEHPSGLRNPRVLAVFVLLAILGVFFAVRAFAPDAAPAPPSESSARQAPAQAAPTPPAAAQAPPGNGPAPADPAGVQLTTVRHVWVRITADGVKTLERELPADSRIPIDARESIVIRAGDAGAVRMVIGGKDQGPLGPDGVVRTRAFTPPR